MASLPKQIILGIDPGATTAYAAISLKGDILKVEEHKNSGLTWIISQLLINNYKPIIVATDKKHTPGLIKKISAIFNLFIFSPSQDLTTKEKKELLKQLNLKLSPHEADALAAALLCYKTYRTTLLKIERALYEIEYEIKKEFPNIKNLDTLLDSARILMLKGINKREVKNKLQQAIKNKQPILPKKHIEQWEKIKADTITEISLELEKANAKIKALKEKIEQLELKLTTPRDQKIHLLKQEIDKERALRIKYEKALSHIQKDIEHLLVGILKGKYKVIPRFNNIIEKIAKYDYRDYDYVFIDDPNLYDKKIIKQLIKKQLCLISYNQFPSSIKNKLPTLTISKNHVKYKHQDLVVVDAHVLKNKEEILAQLQHEHKEEQEKRKKTEIDIDIEKILIEYKKERGALK